MTLISSPHETAGLHFGEKLRNSKLGLNVTRNTYGLPNRKPHQRPNRELQGEDRWQRASWMYRDEEHLEHSDIFCIAWRDTALVNFDVSMAYFDSLDRNEFNVAIGRVLAQHQGFREITDLTEYDQTSGVYLMVFDEYKTMYIGQSRDIRKRVKKHWTGRKPFDRLVFGSEFESIFPVDEFRPLDNTRLYAVKTKDIYNVEKSLTQVVDRRFSLNRIDGGLINLGTLVNHGLAPRTQNAPLKMQSMTSQQYRDTWDVLTTQLEAMRKNGSDVAKDFTQMPPHFYEVTRDDGSIFIWTFRIGVRTLAARRDISLDEYLAYLKSLGEDPILLDR